MNDIIAKIKKKPVVAIIIAVVVLFIIIQIFGGSDDSDSSKNNKVSLKNGVLAIIPELRLGMTFNEIPQEWIPDYKEYPDWINIQWSYNGTSYKQIEYDGIPLTVYVQPLDTPDSAENSTSFVYKDEFDTKPILGKVVCEAYLSNKITKERNIELYDYLKSCYGEPIGELWGYIYWEEGDNYLTFGCDDTYFRLEVGKTNVMTEGMVKKYKK